VKFKEKIFHIVIRRKDEKNEKLMIVRLCKHKKSESWSHTCWICFSQCIEYVYEFIVAMYAREIVFPVCTQERDIKMWKGKVSKNSNIIIKLHHQCFWIASLTKLSKTREKFKKWWSFVKVESSTNTKKFYNWKQVMSSKKERNWKL
jgi:hypothetical protein